MWRRRNVYTFLLFKRFYFYKWIWVFLFLGSLSFLFHSLFSLVLWMLWCGFRNMTGNSLIHAQDLNGMKRYNINFHQKLFRMCHMLSMNMLCFPSSSLKFVILSTQTTQKHNAKTKHFENVAQENWNLLM